jgi:hypothetical protein
MNEPASSSVEPLGGWISDAKPAPLARQNEFETF